MWEENKRLVYIFFFLSFLLVTIRVYSDDLNNWFKSDSRSKPYRNYKYQLSEIFEDAHNSGIPRWILLEKLKEGAGKRVDPVKIVSALKEELIRLKIAKSIVEDEEISDATGVILKRISLILLGEINSETVMSLLDAAREDGKTVDDALSVCELLLQIHSVSPLLKSSQLSDLGKVIISSRLKSKSYSAIASIYLKAKAMRIKDSDILLTMSEIIKNGGGIIQLDSMLTRREGFK